MNPQRKKALLIIFALPLTFFALFFLMQGGFSVSSCSMSEESFIIQ